MEIKRLIVGEIYTNCYLLISQGELGILDPGGDTEKILKEINKTGVKAKYIINTHYHFDHTLSNKKIKNKTKAEILIHEKEKDFIDFEADKFLHNGDEITIGDINLKVVHTPGHSKGSICLLGNGFIFTGDTVFKDGYGRTDLPGGSSMEIEESLQKLLRILKPGMTVYPGHGEIFKYYN